MHSEERLGGLACEGMALSSHGRIGSSAFRTALISSASTVGAVEKVYAPPKRETARIGLTINSTKAKYIISGRGRGRPGCASAG